MRPSVVIERPPKFHKNQSYIFVEEIEPVREVHEEVINGINSSVEESSLDEFSHELQVEESKNCQNTVQLG